MRLSRLSVLTVFACIAMTPPAFAQDDVLDFDRDCLSNSITSAELLGDCSLMLVEIAELENAAPAVVDERISKTVDNAGSGGGESMMKDACSKVPLAGYRGSSGNGGKIYAALCTNF